MARQAMRLGLFHFGSARVDQSSPCRRLAAAANGPMTKLTSESAHRIENGVPNDSGPDIAACEAATPKISTGIDSGSTHTPSNNPPRWSVTASAAPIMPVNVSAGVPTSKVSATAAVAETSRFNNSPRTGVAITSGNPAGDPVRQRFRRAGQFQRGPAHHDQVEGTVVMVRREQPIERQQAG